MHSTDGGDHWQAAPLPGPQPTASSLVVSPDFQVDGRVFCATFQNGIFVSSHRGANWGPENAGLPDHHVMSLGISLKLANDQTLLAGTESGIFRSRNGGQNWQLIDYFPGQAEVVSSMAISPSIQFVIGVLLFAESFTAERVVGYGLTWLALAVFTIDGRRQRRRVMHQNPETR